jgi:hypothetical protein
MKKLTSFLNELIFSSHYVFSTFFYAHFVESLVGSADQ